MFLTDEECLTDEHYLIAKHNGISRRNVRQRFWDYGWGIEKAITEPIPVKTGEWEKWKEIATQNKVSCPCYHRRVKAGMTPEQAATTYVGPRGSKLPKRFSLEQVAEIRELHKYWKYTQAQLGRKYGVSRTTIHNIIHKKGVYENV